MSEMSSRNRLLVVGVLIALVTAAALVVGLVRGDDTADQGAPRTTSTGTATAGGGGGDTATGPGASGTASVPQPLAPGPGAPSAAPSVAVPPGMGVVRVAQLPAEARTTLRLIDAGGPFPYRQDGAVFGNREGRLPQRKNGYYREYTVETPGSPDRGARRIVTGSPGELYYTSDHYETFRVIVR